MKTKLAITAIALALAGTGLSQTTTWFFQGTDNSVAAVAAAGGTAPTGSTSISLGTTTIDENAPTSNAGAGVNTTTSYVTDPVFGAGNQQIISMIGFGPLGLSQSVSEAFYYFNVTGAFSNAGNSMTFSVVPINGAWTEGTANWNNSSSLIDTLSAPLSTFVINPATDVGTWQRINVTSIIENIRLGGTNTGVAIYSNNFESFDFAGNSLFNQATEDNATTTLRPGLSVTTIPEPSAALLGAFGALALLRRRRA